MQQGISIRRHWTTLAALLLLSILVAQVALSTRQQSPSWDEGDHIFSGYMNWKHREYSLNPEHPPLVKLIATLPLLPLSLRVAPRQGRFFKSEAYYGGRELLFRNDPRYGGLYSADTLLFRVHMAVLFFALLLGGLIFLAAREIFGPTAALLALALFVFDPTILANAPFVATDTGAACGIFAAIYTLYRAVKLPRVPRALLCGVVTGLALTTKHSAVLLLPIFLLLLAVELFIASRRAGGWPRSEAAHLARTATVIAASALFVLWGVYSFRYAMHPIGSVLPTLAQQMTPLSAPMRALISFVARYHLLPESYLYGLVDVQRVALEMPTYIFGKVYAQGQWFYFPALLSLKWTVGFLGLLGIALYVFATGKLRRPARELWFLALPPIFFLAVAMASPLNIGVRHVLPVFPFAFVLAGAGAAWFARQSRLAAAVVAALLLWHVADSVRTFPNYIPYANVLWGGPGKTNLYFSDSATDWAQQLKWTKQWTDAHHVTDCSFAYFAAPFLLPSDYSIPCKLLPTLDTMYEGNIVVPPIVHGPILVSFGDLNGFEFGTKLRNPYQRLFERAPDDVIANGIAVFYGDVALPEAAALGYEHQSSLDLAKNPSAALAEAKAAVSLVPTGFDANLALGDALMAAGALADAHAAYATAAARIPEMEPTAQQVWKPRLEQKLAGKRP